MEVQELPLLGEVRSAAHVGLLRGAHGQDSRVVAVPNPGGPEEVPGPIPGFKTPFPHTWTLFGTGMTKNVKRKDGLNLVKQNRR